MTALARLAAIVTAAADELHEANDRADQFSFDPACRRLAEHFLPGSDAIGLDYLAQALMDCATDFIAAQGEMKC